MRSKELMTILLPLPHYIRVSTPHMIHHKWRRIGTLYMYDYIRLV